MCPVLCLIIVWCFCYACDLLCTVKEMIQSCRWALGVCVCVCVSLCVYVCARVSVIGPNMGVYVNHHRPSVCVEIVRRLFLCDDDGVQLQRFSLAPIDAFIVWRLLKHAPCVCFIAFSVESSTGRIDQSTV